MIEVIFALYTKQVILMSKSHYSVAFTNLVFYEHDELRKKKYIFYDDNM